MVLSLLPNGATERVGDLPMWNKRKEEEYTPKPNSAPAPASNLNKENKPAMPATATPGISMPESSRGSAIIGKSVTIKGQIFSQEDLTIDGEMEGSVELRD